MKIYQILESARKHFVVSKLWFCLGTCWKEWKPGLPGIAPSVWRPVLEIIVPVVKLLRGPIVKLLRGWNNWSAPLLLWRAPLKSFKCYAKALKDFAGPLTLSHVIIPIKRKTSWGISFGVLFVISEWMLCAGNCSSIIKTDNERERRGAGEVWSWKETLGQILLDCRMQMSRVLLLLEDLKKASGLLLKQLQNIYTVKTRLANVLNF